MTFELNGPDDYMKGLASSARFGVPGSLRVAASTGDERNAMLMLTYLVDFGLGNEADFGAGACGVSRGGTPPRLAPHHSPSAAVTSGCCHQSAYAPRRAAAS